MINLRLIYTKQQYKIRIKKESDALYASMILNSELHNYNPNLTISDGSNLYQTTRTSYTPTTNIKYRYETHKYNI